MLDALQLALSSLRESRQRPNYGFKRGQLEPVQRIMLDPLPGNLGLYGL